MNLFKNTRDFCQNFRKQGKIVLTNGCFDILHIGHLRYLKSSKALGDQLIVALNSDASVKALKGPSRPINDEETRAEMLLGLKCVDAVIIFDEDTPLSLIKELKPNILTKGGNYDFATVVGSEFVSSYGGEVKIIPFEDGFSTTGIIDKITKENQTS